MLGDATTPRAPATSVASPPGGFRPRRGPAAHVLQGAFWVAVYLALVLAPLFAMLVGTTLPGRGFWWDFSLALGFAGTTMMGVQFVLTARFRRATAPYGIDVIYYFHRYVAVVCLAVLVAHPALLLGTSPALLALLDPRTAPAHMTAGVGALAGLGLLVATSLWRKRLGIPYEGWRVAHVLVAAATVACAVVHIAGVGYYAAEPWKRGLWTAIVASWLALLVWVRVIRPWTIRHTPYRVASVARERGRAWTLRLAPDGHPGLPRFAPGQFAWVSLRANPFAMREHPFSIASAPAPDGHLDFTIKELGDFTRTIGQIAAGERAYVDGPYGAFTTDRHPAPAYVFVAGGIGIAPIASMLRALADRGDRRPLLLFHGNRLWENVPLREAIAALESRLALHVVHVLEEPPPGWAGERGYITPAVLARHLPVDRQAPEYFICGPAPMIQSVERALYRLGVPLGRSHSEIFDLV